MLKCVIIVLLLFILSELKDIQKAIEVLKPTPTFTLLSNATGLPAPSIPRCKDLPAGVRNTICANDDPPPVVTVVAPPHIEVSPMQKYWNAHKDITSIPQSDDATTDLPSK